MTEEELAAARDLLYDAETGDPSEHLKSDWAFVRYDAQVKLAGRALLAEIERLRDLEIDREWAAVDEKVLAKLQSWYDASRPVVEAVADWTVLDRGERYFTAIEPGALDEAGAQRVIAAARAALGKDMDE